MWNRFSPTDFLRRTFFFSFSEISSYYTSYIPHYVQYGRYECLCKCSYILQAVRSTDDFVHGMYHREWSYILQAVRSIYRSCLYQRVRRYIAYLASCVQLISRYPTHFPNVIYSYDYWKNEIRFLILTKESIECYILIISNLGLLMCALDFTVYNQWYAPD
jgi:hypothetical protein